MGISILDMSKINNTTNLIALGFVYVPYFKLLPLDTSVAKNTPLPNIKSLVTGF